MKISLFSTFSIVSKIVSSSVLILSNSRWDFCRLSESDCCLSTPSPLSLQTVPLLQSIPVVITDSAPILIYFFLRRPQPQMFFVFFDFFLPSDQSISSGFHRASGPWALGPGYVSFLDYALRISVSSLISTWSWTVILRLVLCSLALCWFLTLHWMLKAQAYL